MQNLLQRRKELRFPVRGVEATLEGPGDVQVINVSRRGIAFEAAAELETGNDYYLELRYRGQKANVATKLRWAACLPGDEGQLLFRGGGPFVEAVGTVQGVWRTLFVEPAAFEDDAFEGGEILEGGAPA